jgi:hypothetical protein
MRARGSTGGRPSDEQARLIMAMMFELTVALVFLLVGSGLLVWTVWNVISALDSRRWPEAPGTIVVSDLQRSKDGDGGILALRSAL